MHEGILDKHRLKAELFRAEPRKPFLVNKRLKRMKICNKHINPHIELVPI